MIVYAKNFHTELLALEFYCLFNCLDVIQCFLILLCMKLWIESFERQDNLRL